MTLAVSLWWLPIVTDDTGGWAVWRAGQCLAGPFADEDAAALGLHRMLEN